MARKNAIVSVSIENGVLTYSALEQSGSLNLSDLSTEIYTPSKAGDAGLVHKVSLGAAKGKDELPSDPTEAAAVKFAGMKAVADRLLAGEWGKRGEGTGQPSGVIYRAFAEWVATNASKKGIEAPTDEKVRAVYDAKTRAEQLALRNVPAIAKIIERLKSESGAEKGASVDTASLLDEVFA